MLKKEQEKKEGYKRSREEEKIAREYKHKVYYNLPQFRLVSPFDVSEVNLRMKKEGWRK